MEVVIVTGGAGFIGRHLCSALLNKGDKVFCIDNLSTGKISNIKDFMNNPNFTFIEEDIAEIKVFPIFAVKIFMAY